MSNTRKPSTPAARKAVARKAQATGQDIPLEFRGVTYTLPADPDIDVFELADDEKFIHATRALLGADQYKVFRDRHSKSSELESFLEAAFEAMGGNSQASSRSSASTGTR